jgi:hypothetical protein
MIAGDKPTSWDENAYHTVALIDKPWAADVTELRERGHVAALSSAVRHDTLGYGSIRVWPKQSITRLWRLRS